MSLPLFGCTLAMLIVCGFAPGFWLLRRVQGWRPLEKLCASIALSWVLIYLFTLIVAWSGLKCSWCWAGTALCAAAGVSCRNGARRLLADRHVRRVLGGFLVLFLWVLLATALVRHFSIYMFQGDWIHHWRKTLVFLGQGTPAQFGEFAARPPQMNLIGAFFLAQLGQEFGVFQIVFSWLNLLCFLPLCLLAPALVTRNRRRPIWLLVALLAFNPMFVMNATYTWTKLLPAFYVLLALWFYLAALRRDDHLRMLAAMACAWGATAGHYVALPFLVFLAMHYLLFTFRKRPYGWRELAWGATVPVVVLGPWLAFAAIYTGHAVSFSSFAGSGISDLVFLRNLGSRLHSLTGTIFPHIMNRDDLRIIGQYSTEGYVRDCAGFYYQYQLIIGMGSIGGPTVIWLLWKALRTSTGIYASAQRRFWFLCAPVCTVLGTLIVADSGGGSAQICLQPLIVLGLALLAMSLAGMHRIAVALVLLGACLDFALGVFLNYRIQNVEFAVQRVAQGMQIDLSRGEMLTLLAFNNWLDKARNHLVFFGDYFADYSAQLQILMLGGAAILALLAVREIQKMRG
jgi:hypothetical protein